MVNLEDYKLRLLKSISDITASNSRKVIWILTDPDFSSVGNTIKRHLYLSYTAPLNTFRAIWLNCDRSSADFGKLFKFSPTKTEVTSISDVFDGYE